MKLSRVKIADLSGGVQTKTTPDMALANQVPHCINGDFNVKIGGIVGRKGSNKQSQVVAGQVVENLALFPNGGITKQYIAVAKDGLGQKDIYVSDLNFATWAKCKEDIGVTAEPRFENFAKKLVIVDGVNAPQFWDGTTFTTITNAPTNGLFVSQFEQRLFIFTEDSFLHYSDVIASTGLALSSTTWLNRGISPNDGQSATGLVRFRGLLRIFKSESIYNYDGSNEPDPIINIGTRAKRSIVVTDDALFFHHKSGWYMMSGGLPVKISGRVQKFFDGAGINSWTQASGGKDIHGNVYLWIGDVAIQDTTEFDYGTTYNDVVLVYNTKTQNLAVYDNWNARVWMYSDTTGKTFFGDDDGKVFEINVGYSDVDGTSINAINFELIFNPLDFDYPERFKEVEQIVVSGEHQLKLRAGESYETMEDVEKLKDTDGNELYGQMNQKLTVKELWYGVSQTYTSTPPYIKKVYLDNINISDDER